MSGQHDVKEMCTTLRVSRSGYYAWRERKRRVGPTRNGAVLVQIAAIHARSRQTYGSPRITRELREQGTLIGRHRVARLMRAVGLRGRQRRRYRIRTTDSLHGQFIAPNRMVELPPPKKPDRIWLSDITYVPTEEGWLFVAGVLDRCTRRIVGWSMGAALDSSLAVAALKMALARRQPRPGLVHHSDRGAQYACDVYQTLLENHGVIASMSRSGNCYDNAVMESFWSTLKHELVYRHRFATRAAASSAIFDYIERFYNRVRRHSSLGYQSPLAYESSLS